MHESPESAKKFILLDKNNPDLAIDHRVFIYINKICGAEEYSDFSVDHLRFYTNFFNEALKCDVDVDLMLKYAIMMLKIFTHNVGMAKQGQVAEISAYPLGTYQLLSERSVLDRITLFMCCYVLNLQMVLDDYNNSWTSYFIQCDREMRKSVHKMLQHKPCLQPAYCMSYCQFKGAKVNYSKLFIHVFGANYCRVASNGERAYDEAALYSFEMFF